MGPCLTDAAPEAAPAELFAGKPLRQGPNLNLSDRCGKTRRWFHGHLSVYGSGVATSPASRCTQPRSDRVTCQGIALSQSVTTERVVPGSDRFHRPAGAGAGRAIQGTRLNPDAQCRRGGDHGPAQCGIGISAARRRISLSNGRQRPSRSVANSLSSVSDADASRACCSDASRPWASPSLFACGSLI